MNTPTPETDDHAFYHAGVGCKICTPEFAQKLERQRNALFEALRTLDRQMSGNETYEHAWTNYPTKPETSPASLVRKAISENAEL